MHPTKRRFWSVLSIASLIITTVVAAAGPAAHAAVGLPSGYDVQRIDDPNPAIGNQFAGHFVNAGDIDGDGEGEILMGIDEHGGIEGYVHLFGGDDGSLIRSIPIPEPSTTGRPTAWGNYTARLPDIGSCPGGGNGAVCPAGSIAGSDGVPEHVIGAGGVDEAGPDVGRVYVVDGASGAILKRIDMPAADREDHQAAIAAIGAGDPRTGFGATVLVPSGQVPCEGNMGVGPCDELVQAVAIGDVDGGGVADMVLAARAFSERGPQDNPACDPGPCFQSGRVYVYRGEDVVGSDPSEILSEPLYTVRNRLAQSDDPDTSPRYSREALGYSLSPLGDVGACTNNARGAGEWCLSGNMTTTPDGAPDFVASVHRVDMFGMGDVGAAVVIDGASGAIIHLLDHPDPQPTSIFGYSRTNQPAVGDAGSSILPDAVLGAMVQNTEGMRATGAAYVLNGDAKFGGANHQTLSVLHDPTPHAIGNFGPVSGGVGDLVGDSHKEVFVGAAGPHAPQIIDSVINDVHIFSPLDSTVLQTIRDPDQQEGGGFGRAWAPLGDVNGDGFLDLAIGADLFDGVTGANQGRLYIFRSNDQAAPSTDAARIITLHLGRHLVARGAVTAPSGPAACARNVQVMIKRNGVRVARTTTNENGRYRVRLEDRPGRYKAVAKPVVRADTNCLRAVERERHRH